MNKIFELLEEKFGSEDVLSIKDDLIKEICTEIASVVSDVVCSDGKLKEKASSPFELFRYFSERYSLDDNISDDLPKQNQKLEISNYIHIKTNKEYRVIRKFLFKINGEWVDSVFYTNGRLGDEMEFYGRTEESFLSKFKKSENRSHELKTVFVKESPEHFKIRTSKRK